jgi:hypothetical protein
LTPIRRSPKLAQRRRGGIEILEAKSERNRVARDVKVTLGVGVALIAAVGALTLTRSPPRVVRVGAPSRAIFPLTVSSAEVCQANEVLPAGVSAIRVWLGAYFGSRVRVVALANSQVLTEGVRSPNWTGGAVTVPVTAQSHATSGVTLCFDAAPNSELLYLGVAPASQAESAVWRGKALGARVGVEYLAAGRGSWWSRILTVARHIGIGHALGGTWVVLLIAALAAAVGVLAVRLVVRELP